MLDKTDPQRFVWLGRAASAAATRYGQYEMLEQLKNFNSGHGTAKVGFAIGKALKGQINMAKREIFGTSYSFDFCIGPAKQALRFYIFQLQACRKAVGAWTLVGLRYRVAKDIRGMNGKMVWDSREEAKYGEIKSA